MHENSYQNILMAFVSAGDNLLFWLDKHRKVYIYESSMLVLLCVDSNSAVRDKLLGPHIIQGIELYKLLL